MTTSPQIVIPKGLIDSKPDVALLLDLAEYYEARKLPDTGVDSEVAFDSPRTQLMVRTAVKGTVIAEHWHSVTDEIVLVVGGAGEILVNNEWRPVKRGDLHVCPRGIVHGTKALREDLRFLSIFTPHLPPGGDINWLK